MQAAALRIELRIPESRSLKAKRRVLQSLIAELRNQVSVSAAEVDRHDEWQRSSIGVAIVAATAAHLDDLVDAVERVLDARIDVEVVEIGISYLEDPV
jgi:uncharacterized protein YlxP (DUF503 family)